MFVQVIDGGLEGVFADTLFIELDERLAHHQHFSNARVCTLRGHELVDLTPWGACRVSCSMPSTLSVLFYSLTAF